MITNDDQLAQLRDSLRRVMRGLWARRRPTPELLELVSGEPPLGRRHVGLLAQIGTEGERSVGELARELDLSLPAASKLTRDLEDHGLVERREDPETGGAPSWPSAPGPRSACAPGSSSAASRWSRRLRRSTRTSAQRS